MCPINSKSLLPEWEETLIFNEHPTHFTNNEKLIIFFEVLDFPISTSMATMSHRQSQLDSSPWYKIAWGFVRPAGKIGTSQIGEKCRLQLFQYPRRRFRRLPETNEVFNNNNNNKVSINVWAPLLLHHLIRYTTCGLVAIVLRIQARSM